VSAFCFHSGRHRSTTDGQASFVSSALAAVGLMLLLLLLLPPPPPLPR
jgi:hypothetical protein